MNVIKSVMAESYEPNIDYSKNINKQDLMPETFAIMAVIYRDFICSKEKRKELLEEEKKKLEKIEEEKREMYNPDNLFKNRKKENEETKLIEYKQSIFKKIINKIKEIFHKY